MAESSGVPSVEDDGPECETCGKTACPDAQLPAFSEPRDCAYAPIYEAIKGAKDCDYGCSRDYSNQAVCLWMVPAIEKLLTEARAEALERAAAELDRAQRIAKTKTRDVTPEDAAWWRASPLSDDGLFDTRPLLAAWLRARRSEGVA